MRKLVFPLMLFASCVVMAQGQRHRISREAFTTENPMVHDPVMAYEDSTWYLFATGMGIQQMTSKDRKQWTVHPEPLMSVIPKWTHDSVPGFRSHVWAPDVIQWHGRWWLAYSCSTFGRNGSAIGLLSTRSLASGLWNDEGCIVASREKRDNWNAIDPNFVIDDNDNPWLVWGSFWDGIQIVRLDTTMHIVRVRSLVPLPVVSIWIVRQPRRLFRLIRILRRIRPPIMPVRMPLRPRSSSSMTAGTISLYPGITVVRVPRATTVLP